MLAQHPFAVCLATWSPHASREKKHCQHVSKHVPLKSIYTPKYYKKLHMVAEHGCSITKTLRNLFLIIVVTMSASANSTVDTKLLGKPKAYTNRRGGVARIQVCVAVLRRCGVEFDPYEDGRLGAFLATGLAQHHGQ